MLLPTALHSYDESIEKLRRPSPPLSPKDSQANRYSALNTVDDPSKPRDETEQETALLSALSSILGPHCEDALQELVPKLLAAICGPCQSKREAALPTMMARLARMAQGEINALAAVQSALVEHFQSHENAGPDGFRDEPALGEALASLAQAFADYGPITSDRSPTQPQGRDHDFLQQIIDAVADPIFVKDEDHRWIFLNNAYCDFMGYSHQELVGMSDYDFFPEEEADVFWRKDDLVFSTGEPDENEERFTDADGVEHIIVTKKSMFVDSRRRRYLVGIIRDITERRRLEARLAVARRLMSLGTLAGGVAHEINNPLAFVLANLDYLRGLFEDLDDVPPEALEILETTLEGAVRVREIVSGLRTFSDSDSDADALSPVDLRQSLKHSVQLMAHEIRDQAEIIENYDEIPLVDGNDPLLGQIFLNLLINAAQSLDTGGARENTIRIETKTGEEGEAIVEISDTGRGISEGDLDHIFDPFYSTKPVGEGTGLGLAICHSLVDAMSGHIEVESKPNKGSTFRVVLPPIA